MKTAIKPANYYASSVSIPPYVEQVIASLSQRDRLHLAADIISAMQGDDAVFLANTDIAQWLRSQGYESLLSVLKWVTSELI